jgi:hypothetical protein
MLSFTDHKKAMWYVEKGLGKLTCEDPLTVTLNFEPTGRKENVKQENIYDDNFYVSDRSNMCVKCSKPNEYARFHIVPTVYRVHLPENLKSHRSHDVVLLCFDCHNLCSRKQDILKKEIAKKYESNHL